jgi:IPT/TIG domain
VLTSNPVVIESVEPREGREGTIVTLRGSGFARHVRNNCVVVGGMAACARAQPDSTDTELKVRIGPVARATSGDILMWPGIGADLHTQRIAVRSAKLDFSEVAIFRNGYPVTSAGVQFRLTEESPNTYAGVFEHSAASRAAQLGGYERSPVMRARFPKDFTIDEGTTVDICLVLKEPTLAIDLTAALSGHENAEAALDAVALSISQHAQLVGEEVYADAVRDQETGELQLYVTKPNLLSGMLVVHFNTP